MMAALLLGGLLSPGPAVADGVGVFTLEKTASDPGPYAPGDTFSYTIDISCSNTTGEGCDGAVLTDELPPPLVLDPASAQPVTVIGSSTSTVETTEDSFAITFTDDLERDLIGLEANSQMTITVDVLVPEDASADDAGTLTNTATATADNAATANATADVILEVDTILDSTVTKEITAPGGEPVVGVPGEEVDFSITGGNASNATVDSLVIQDPADGADDPFEYLELTGIASITPPDGADTVQVDWQSEDGTWTEGTPVSPIPDDPNELLAGVDLADVHGLRFTFTGPDGVPITPEDGQAVIELETETRDNVEDIEPGETVTVDNTASSLVNLDDASSDPVTDDDTVPIVRNPPTVDVDKSYALDTLPAGDSTTASIVATNGTTPVDTMVITEPSPGTPDLVDQGLTFDGFDDDAIEWPVAATGVSIQYTYDDGFVEDPKTSTTVDTIPAPTAGHRVSGFTITFTGPIAAESYATLPFDVTADPVEGILNVDSTNTVDAQVSGETGESDVAQDSADLTRQPIRIATDVDKEIVRGQIPGATGSGTTISLDGSIPNDRLTGATIGVDYLVVSDPANPTGSPSNDFWNCFQLTSVGPVDVPANADLEVEYWDGDSWEPVPGGTIEGPGTFTYSPTAAESAAAQGVRFTFTPKDGALLPPGFNVLAYYNVELRDECIDGTDVTPWEGDPLTLTNDAGSEAGNDDAVNPVVVDDDSDSIIITPVDAGDIDSIDKTWLMDGAPTDNATVTALTDDQRTARISWSTQGFPADSYEVTDPATDPQDVVTSVFDAFDLVSIQPITPATDPHITFDAVDSVELYQDGTGWVDITAQACANGCDGQFGGYTLTAEQQASTLGVRMEFVESPTRADRITAPTDPQVGTGVAVSEGNDRPIDLVFQLRQQLRSDPTQAVLGTEHDYTYNTGDAGVVDNTVQGVGILDGVPSTATDDAQITILDRPVNVSLTKAFDQDVLGVPPEGTPQELYPLITGTLVATNESPSKLRMLTVLDPDVSPALRPEPFRTTNLYEIAGISVPAGATGTVVNLNRDWGPVPTPYTLEEALALTPGDLADVTSIEVVHTGFIESQASTEIELVFQLRQTDRATGDPVAAPYTVDNEARATASNPEDTVDTTASDSFGLTEPTYGVEAGKEITPAERYENETNDYTVVLHGQPTGTVRTTTLTMTDTTATFWNAFDFVEFDPVTLSAPIRQVKVDALVGVTYDLQGGELLVLCNGSETLDDCWVEGDYVASDASGAITPVLPAGVAAGDVEGLRISAQNEDGTQWERPSNPSFDIPFSAVQRDTLRYGIDGATDTPVPSTLPGLEAAPGETVQGQTTDTVDVNAEGLWGVPGSGTPWEADASATDTTLLRHLSNGISVTKTPGNPDAPPEFSPGQPIPYQVSFTNTGQWPITGLELTDQIQTDADGSLLVEPRDSDGSPAPEYVFTLTDAEGNPQPTDGFSASLDETTGLMTITVPDGFVLEPGWTLTLSAPLEFRAGVSPGTVVENTVSASSDRPFDTCEYTTDATVTDTSQIVDDCSATTHVTPRAAAPVAVQKSVKGNAAGVEGASPGDQNYDDLGRLVTDAGEPVSACDEPNAPNGFYRTPCVPITRPGGIETWQLQITNNGNIPAPVLAGIDTKPQFGDVGVITGTPRGSEWAVEFIGNVTNNLDDLPGDGEIQWYYIDSTPGSDCNRQDILNETEPDGLDPADECYDEVTSRDWVPFDASTPTSDLLDAQALKFVITWDGAGEGLQPGDSVFLTADTRTAWAVPNGVTSEYPISWNSIAAGSRGEFDGESFVSQVIEPTRVGVSTATGKLELQKVVDAPEIPGVVFPTQYTVRVTCTSGPEPVFLATSEPQGSDASLVQLPADGTVITFNASDTYNVPLYADCSIAEEPPAQGAEVTYDPAGDDPGTSGDVVAYDDQSDRTDIAEPAFPDPIELEQITVTNTYALAGFLVEKTVDNGGAVDEDGNPIVYDETYDFNATCTFQGQTVLDEDFTLEDGDEPEEFRPLPAGAECTVEETDAGGSASTSIVVTQTGEEGEPVDGTSVTFTLDPDAEEDVSANAVDVTNTYTVGSAEITKAVEGNGAEAWGDGPFEVRLVCTYDGADPATVYDDTHTLTPPDDLTWTVDNLPTGSDCVVTETDDGGATGVEIEGGEFTVGDDAADPSLVTVTNTFTVGGVELTKELLGTANDVANVRDTGHLEFELTCTYEGEPVVIPDGAVRVIDYPSGDPDTVSWGGIPVGSDCVVEETVAVPEPELDYIPNASFTIGEDGEDPITVEAINIYTPGWLVLDKVVTGDAAQFAPDDFEILVQCERNGAPETLPNGGVVTLPGDGTPVFLAPVPEGSECHVDSETDAGATDVDLGETVTIPIFDPQDPEPPRAEITVTNTYDATGFSVEKSVEGATDADGNPITYTAEFPMTASCTFLDEEVVPEGDRTFTLTQDATKEFAGLPVGATCVVEETDAAGATSTTVDVLQDGEPVVPDDQTDTSSGTFTLVEGGTEATLVGITNTLPLGSVAVTKVVDGDGAAAWGDGEFEVRLLCTYEGADPTTVYDATHTLSAADPSWTVDTLPVGADCDVTETATGGATTSTVAPADGVVVGDDPESPAEVTVTNTFDVGAIDVEKVISGPGADDRGGERFTVELTCTRDVDGEAEDIEIPGGAERTLQRPSDLMASYEGLPVGAECTMTETEDGGAEKATVEPGTVTVEGGGEDVKIVVTNRFDAAPASGEGESDLPGAGSVIPPLLVLLAMSLLAAGLTIVRGRRRREA